MKICFIRSFSFNTDCDSVSHRITLWDWSHIIISTTFGTYHSFYPLLQSNLCTSCFLLSICFQTIWRISHESPTLDLDLYYDLITSVLMKDKKKNIFFFFLSQSYSRRKRLTCGRSGFWIRCSSRKWETFWPQTSFPASSLTFLKSTSCMVGFFLRLCLYPGSDLEKRQ